MDCATDDARLIDPFTSCGAYRTFPSGLNADFDGTREAHSCGPLFRWDLRGRLGKALPHPRRLPSCWPRPRCRRGWGDHLRRLRHRAGSDAGQVEAAASVPGRSRSRGDQRGCWTLQAQPSGTTVVSQVGQQFDDDPVEHPLADRIESTRVLDVAARACKRAACQVPPRSARRPPPDRCRPRGLRRPRRLGGPGRGEERTWPRGAAVTSVSRAISPCAPQPTPLAQLNQPTWTVRSRPRSGSRGGQPRAVGPRLKGPSGPRPGER